MIMEIKINEIHGYWPTSFGIKLARRFRPLSKLPKCWEEVSWCITKHGSYESGSTTIYQSRNTKKYYLVRYFDGCFNKMYAEDASGIDWKKIESTLKECKSLDERHNTLERVFGKGLE